MQADEINSETSQIVYMLAIKTAQEHKLGYLQGAESLVNDNYSNTITRKSSSILQHKPEILKEELVWLGNQTYHCVLITQ